jgi:hypothetical protein
MKRSLDAVANRGRRPALAAFVLAASILAMVAVATASARAPAVFSVRGAAGAGPARYDRVLVERFGPASARTVLVLVPGSGSGAGAFGFIGRDLVRRVPGLQVWAVERREHAFEDTSVIERGDPDQSLAYYLQGQPVDGHTFQPPPASEVGFMAKWGLGLLLGDLRRVVRKARAGGRRVILGGHSLGASAAEAYACWDFDGRSGHRDLAGLVLIDGGLDGRIAQPTLGQARAQLREFETAPRFDPFNQRAPWVYGVASAIAGLYAQEQPQNRSPLDTVALVPAAVQPQFPSTNQTWLGWVRSLLYPAQEAAAAHAGHPAASGNPRAWVDGDITPIARLARWLAQAPINTVDWYVPRRLLLDAQAADPLKPTRLTRLLGLRLKHRRAIHLPLYAFQTSSTAPHVLRAARRLTRISRIASPTLAADPTMIHSDPLTALPARNSFLRTVTPFLKHLAH